MTFPHAEDDWQDLIAVVSQETGRTTGMVEKDYWVCHTLWAIHQQGFAVWFKGGTSLSKGFGLIDRFSEDIDVRIDAGTVQGLREPRLSWKNSKTQAVKERDTWFGDLAKALHIPNCTVSRDPGGSDKAVRSAWLAVQYPAHHAGDLIPDMRPFVLLEVGRARVIPSLDRDLSSWVHDFLQEKNLLGQFTDNRPKGVRCVHPWVTCLEKLAAIARRFDAGKSAADFVRHYDDAARIVMAWDQLPAPGQDLRALVASLKQEDNTEVPPPDHPAFSPEPTAPRWQEIAEAWRRIAPMYWSNRARLEVACQSLRTFLEMLPRA